MENSYLAFPFAGLALLYVRRTLDTATRLPAWDNVLKKYWLVGGISLGIAAVTSTDISELFWVAAFVAIGLLSWLERHYRPARMLLLALAPFVTIFLFFKLIKWLLPTFYKEYEVYFGSTIGFAVLWLIVFFFIANRQKKDLIKLQEERSQERDVEASLRRIEAEQRRRIEERKAELEAQVSERTAEITRQKEELEQTLVELKATQNQLVHSEKMASLGELTAGIAHEIQNPLNFVNNFSEVSVELLDELAEEQQKASRDPELEAELLTDLRQNLQKISQHGGRASSIVRGMLQHSRASTGQREPTDLNALADEYLRLAYHGLRAKDKTFNAQFSTDLDPDLGLVTVVSQDMGRVLLNLITNAFYAVRQRQKEQSTPEKTAYQPTVRVQTRCQNGKAEIRVIDNGTGIPESAMSKIFMPFFTTKPTGEGTGLGLSMAYDIVTKGHSGTLSVESQEGEGTTFIITLPA